MKNIKLILTALSLSVVGFNIAFSQTAADTPSTPSSGNTDSSTAAPCTTCESCIMTNECATTVQDDVASANGSGSSSTISISSSCMETNCSSDCSRAIKAIADGWEKGDVKSKAKTKRWEKGDVKSKYEAKKDERKMN